MFKLPKIHSSLTVRCYSHCTKRAHYQTLNFTWSIAEISFTENVTSGTVGLLMSSIEHVLGRWRFESWLVNHINCSDTYLRCSSHISDGLRDVHILPNSSQSITHDHILTPIREISSSAVEGNSLGYVIKPLIRIMFWNIFNGTKQQGATVSPRAVYGTMYFSMYL